MVPASVLAQMRDTGHRMDSGWWWVMGVGWLVFLTLLVGLVYLLVRHTTRPPGEPGAASRAAEILDERFARGEIAETECRRDALRR